MVSRRRIIRANHQAAEGELMRPTRITRLKQNHRVEEQAEELRQETMTKTASETTENLTKLSSQLKMKLKTRQNSDSGSSKFHESLLDDALSLNGTDRQLWPSNTKTDRYHSSQLVDRYESGEFERLQQQQQQDSQMKALSKQRRELFQNFDPYSIYGDEDDDEDVWFSEAKLQQDHIQEIVNKWHSIDDEIWAKIICMERNRRIAKAYARQHTISVNGSEDEYLDGTTLGLNSFENPERDSKTSFIKQYIGEGIKLKIHQNGDIFVKRLSNANVFVHQFRPNRRIITTSQAIGQSQSSSDVYALNSSEGSSSQGGEFYGIVRPRPDKRRHGQPATKTSPKQELRRHLSDKGNNLNSGSSSGAYSDSPPPPPPPPPISSASNTNGADHNYQAGGRALQLDKVFKLFSMNKFKRALEIEARKPTPNRLRLQAMCISVVSFVADDRELLNLPSWLMIFNIVAMELLSSQIGLVDPYDLPAADGEKHEVSHWQRLGEEYEHSRDYFDRHGYENDDEEDEENVHRNGLLQADGNKFHDIECKLNDSSRDNRTKKLATSIDDDIYRLGNKLERVGGPTNSIEQMGSASSGFVSSHMNDFCDELMANNTDENSGSNERPINRTEMKSKTKTEIKPRTKTAPGAQARGKRFPKLPHGISIGPNTQLESKEPDADQGEPVVMSGPIPIPAPPTSSGGPTGKANLILVSPTGLSPPTTKKLHAMNPTGPSNESPCKIVSENSLVKPIAPNELKTRRLPQGIPPHAQIAPPAARMHILRYLMSTSQSTTNARDRQPRPPPPLRKCTQRPLPGLPGSRRQLQTDEGLYYRGLQARAMQAVRPQNVPMPLIYGVHRLNPHSMPQRPPPIPMDVSNIISNFKNRALFRQQLAQHRQLMPSTKNQHLSTNGQQQQQEPDKTRRSTPRDPNFELKQSCQLKSRPFMRSLDSIHVKTMPTSNKFHMTSLSTLLNNVGNLIRRNPRVKGQPS